MNQWDSLLQGGHFESGIFDDSLMTISTAPVDHNTGKDGCPPLTEVIMPATVGTWLWQLLGAGAVVVCGTLKSKGN